MRNWTPEVAAVSALVDSGWLIGIKVETEGEGASWTSIQKLNALAMECSLPLTLKIGGCDARTDLRMGHDLGVREFVAPMIETAFSVAKFREATQSVHVGQDRPTFRVLIESKTGVANVQEILDYSLGFVAGVNVGRTDLAKSMDRSTRGSTLSQDSDEVLAASALILGLANEAGFETTLGGRMTARSIRKMCESFSVSECPDRVETRRLVLKWSEVASDPSAIDQALQVERQLAHWLSAGVISESAGWAQYIAELDSRLDPPLDGPVYP